ncbi:hypothetical protein BDV29DRAFT_172989 [Aspergillus leporis]|uniref:Uncharacterized protein n=1 Tax=Aspergillus leporis TaxID=41062 RepID=A0A5N5X256_9EURO|nr:hypothetical protein BDV29DRAFT_172989 [Aspergillus leporis]
MDLGKGIYKWKPTPGERFPDVSFRTEPRLTNLGSHGHVDPPLERFRHFVAKLVPPAWCVTWTNLGQNSLSGFQDGTRPFLRPKGHTGVVPRFWAFREMFISCLPMVAFMYVHVCRRYTYIYT